MSRPQDRWDSASPDFVTRSKVCEAQKTETWDKTQRGHPWAKAHSSLWGRMWEWRKEGTEETSQVTTGGELDWGPRGMDPPAMSALER